MIVAVEAVYFQCARAIVRSGLWTAPDGPRRCLPTPGEILAALSGGREGGEDYDQAWTDRAKRTLW